MINIIIILIMIILLLIMITMILTITIIITNKQSINIHENTRKQQIHNTK